MNIFSQLGGSQQGQVQQMPQQQMNPMQMVSEIKNHPASFLKQRGYNIPENVTNPNDIIQHLMQSGQIQQNQLAPAQQRLMQMMGRR